MQLQLKRWLSDSFMSHKAYLSGRNALSSESLELTTYYLSLNQIIFIIIITLLTSRGGN